MIGEARRPFAELMRNIYQISFKTSRKFRPLCPALLSINNISWLENPLLPFSLVFPPTPSMEAQRPSSSIPSSLLLYFPPPSPSCMLGSTLSSSPHFLPFSFPSPLNYRRLLFVSLPNLAGASFSKITLNNFLHYGAGSRKIAFEKEIFKRGDLS